MSDIPSKEYNISPTSQGDNSRLSDREDTTDLPSAEDNTFPSSKATNTDLVNSREYSLTNTKKLTNE
jgi:hypothetical protein